MTESDNRSSSSRRVTEMMDIGDEIDLLALFGALWRGKLWIVLAIVIAMIIGGYYAYVAAVPMYTSRATVALESRQEQVVDIESVMTGLSGDQASINTEVEVLRSRQLIGKLVKDLNLLDDPEFNGSLREEPGFSLGAVKKFIRNLIFTPQEQGAVDPEAVMDATISSTLHAISISNIRQSYVFQITAVTTSAKKSAMIANKLAALYILDQLEVKFDATEQATSWLTDRVSDLKTELETAEAKVKVFNSGTELVSAEALEGLNRQLKDLRDRIAETNISVGEARDRLTELAAAQDGGDLNAMNTAANDRTLARVFDLVNEGSSSPEVFDARFEQIVVRAQLDHDRLVSQAQALQTSASELETRIEFQSGDLLELRQLQREAEASRLIYEYFLGRLKETSVQQGIQQADSRILSRAVVPVLPSAPRKSMILALSMMLGLIVGAGLVLMREFLQNTFRTSDELELKTGYTVMGTVPRVPNKDRKEILDYVLEKPTSQAAEAIRNLRTSILLSNVDNPPKVIMSTSSLPSEGKTTQSLLLAQNMAALGKRVLLIEGDIRRRVFTQYLDLSETVGLVSVLAGDATFEEAAQHVPKLGLDVLIGEPSKINAADLYASEKFEAFLTEMRQRYDYVIIDTPPVLVVPDARVVGQFVDAIIYTVKWDYTPRSQVSAGLNMFENVGLKVTGLVLGQVDPKGMKRYGYGNYGGYGTAYKGYYEN